MALRRPTILRMVSTAWSRQTVWVFVWRDMGRAGATPPETRAARLPLRGVLKRSQRPVIRLPVVAVGMDIVELDPTLREAARLTVRLIEADEARQEHPDGKSR